ncbi:MAG: DUF3604 domain-containing protein, partial [Deltaproteobacteria bacterium]|nr:DUF3604 domain-containing protein [Deltaproteobacteria bacterium]
MTQDAADAGGVLHDGVQPELAAAAGAQRSFGGWQLPDALCEQPDLVEVGYRDGVPMGADLRLRTEGDGAPTFVL